MDECQVNSQGNPGQSHFKQLQQFEKKAVIASCALYLKLTT